MNQDRMLMNAFLNQNLYFFVRKAFEIIHPNAEFIPAWHVEAMCWQLQQVADGKVRRLLITIPPRHLKSICASVAFVAWVLGRDPGKKVMVASYGQNLAVRHARDFRTLIESPWYRGLFPAMKISPRVNRADEVATTLGGGRKAVTIDGPVTGFGADFVIVDDLMKAIDARLESERQKVKDYYEQSLFSRLDDKKLGGIVAIQQRLHEDDLAGYLIEKGNFEHLNLRAIAEGDETHALNLGKPYTRQRGEPLFPEKEPLEVLEETRKEMTSFNFSAQYQQNPVPPGGNRIRWEWFGTYDEMPERSWFQTVAQSWDTAVTAEPTSDYSVCTTWGYREGHWYLLDVFRDRLEYPDLKRKVIELRANWRVERVLMEDAASGTPLLQEFRNEGLGRLEFYKPRVDKETRLEVQTAKLETGKFLIPREADWLSDFKHELLAFPNGRYDDQVDCVSQFLDWTGTRRGQGWIRQGIHGERPQGHRRRGSRRRSR